MSLNEDEIDPVKAPQMTLSSAVAEISRLRQELAYARLERAETERLEIVYLLKQMAGEGPQREPSRSTSASPQRVRSARRHVRWRRRCDESKRTSIEKTDVWQKLNASTVELKGRVKPYVEQVNATLAATKQ